MSEPLDLDAIESSARDIAESPWLFADDLDDAREVARSALVLVAEVRRLRAQESRVKALIEDDALTDCECGHNLDEHNGMGCYARLSYTPLVTCGCLLTDDRDIARLNLRSALAEDA